MHSGQTYVVTGCSSGIGAETVRRLKAAGATVLGVDINATDTVDTFFEADLADPASIDDLVQRLPSGTNGLANIAGVPPTLPPEDVLKVNLIGLRRLTDGLAPKLADGASIVNLASLAGFGWPDALDQVKSVLALDFSSDISAFCQENSLAQGDGRSYFLSKEAVVAWTFQNRWRWRNRGIRMNSVSPGPVDTPILKDFLETLGDRADEDMAVMDRPGSPNDIAPVVSFLLSNETTWFRGANLTLDGGMSSYLLSSIHEF